MSELTPDQEFLYQAIALAVETLERGRAIAMALGLCRKLAERGDLINRLGVEVPTSPSLSLFVFDAWADLSAMDNAQVRAYLLKAFRLALRQDTELDQAIRISLGDFE